jgi:hypothetical protein
MNQTLNQAKEFFIGAVETVTGRNKPKVKTVGEIIHTFNQTISELDGVKKAQEASIDANEKAIRELEAQNNISAAEIKYAEKVSSKLKDLFN